MNLPNSAAEGYYTGQVILRGDNYSVAVPFAFTILSKVTVHILDENGVEWTKGVDSIISIVRVPQVDIRGSNWFDGVPQLPATLYVPSGVYNVHGMGRLFFNDFLLYDGETQEKPLLLATSATVQRNTAMDIYLTAANARRFTLNTTTFAGLPVFIGEWNVNWRYQNAGKDYEVGLGVNSLMKNTGLHAALPASIDFYVSDTPDDTDFSFASGGYGFSPGLQHFLDLNSAKWYEGAYGNAGFDLRQYADNVYWYSWQFPKIDATTPTLLSYTRDQVSRYRVKYNWPGNLDNLLVDAASFAAGDESTIRMATGGSGAGVYSLSPGFERDIYLKGQFAHRYHAADLNTGQVFEKEFYTRDWTKAYTQTVDFDSQVILINHGWDLQPLPLQDEVLDLGAGPVYPAVTFDNDATTIRLIHPVLGSFRGTKVFGNDIPSVNVFKDGATIFSRMLEEYWWSPSPMRELPINGAGNYRVVITSNSNSQIAYSNISDAGFTLPASDMNPPQVTSLEMPQRFTPNQAITASLVVTDVESGVRAVQMRYSVDDGISWTPLSAVQNGLRYSTSINPGNALTVSLGFTVTDNAGNFLAFTTCGAAIRETPVTLNLAISQTTIPQSSQPVTITLSGTLRNGAGQPLSIAALPISIYLNNKLAGYVRDVKRLPDGSFQHGTIGFDWTFIPTDFISRSGTTQLKFVFDLGTYARQEQSFLLVVNPPIYLPLIQR